MAEFDESKHPRAEDGRFTNGGAKDFRQNESYGNILKENRRARNTLTQKEFAVWYKKLGEIKRGGYVDKMSNGDKLIPIGNKIVVTSGTYEKPKLKMAITYQSEEEMFGELERLRSKMNG